MEPVGVITMFQHLEKRRLRYTNYVGDGDTKSFKIVTDNKLYGDDVKITKKECIGHVQKRIGKAHRDLKKACG